MHWIAWIAIGLVALILIGAIAVRLTMAFVEDDPAALSSIDLEQLGDRSRLNTYFVAPPDAVDRVGADSPAPEFDASVEAVSAALAEILADRPRMRVTTGPQGRVQAVERSFLFRFPDHVVGRAVSVDGGTSLYLYSASRFGRSDLGVNRARVETVLAALAERLGD
jgi:uncharacterized protein (DUF1499 family)